MCENFIDEFIEFIEDYADRQIVEDDEYKYLRTKCRELSSAEDSQEYNSAKADLDFVYQKNLCLYSIKCFAQILNFSGVI